MADVATTTHWWQHPENWTAIFTVATLVLTGLGYTVSASDQQTLIVAGGGGVASLIQVVAVLRRIFASKASS